MSNVALQTAAMNSKRDNHFFDDFHWFVTAHHWTSLVADTTPTVSVGDARNGIVALFTDTTDNNEVAIRTTNELFLGVAGKPMWCETLLQYAENDTNKANVAFGFSNVIAANLLLDNGGGPATTMSGALIYKVDGGTVWKTISSNGTTQTIKTTAITAGGSTGGYYGNNDGYHLMGIKINDYTSTHAQVTYFYDGAQMRDSTYNLPIVDTLAYASLTEMECGVYAKTGGGAGGETINVDYIAYGQTR